MKVNLPLYNDAGLRHLPQLLPLLQPDDTLMLVSGNVANPLELAWLERTLAALDASSPQNVLLATAGLEHLQTFAQAALPASGLVYIYEPNFPNVPEFSWDAGVTLSNLERATQITGGTPLGFKPTGRPLYQRNLEPYGWDYGAFAARADLLLVQTQTYCKKGTFADAIHKLGLQCEGQRDKTLAQVTLDLGAQNGVEATTGWACARAVASTGLAGVTVWNSPRYTEATLTFLGLRQRRV